MKLFMREPLALNAHEKEFFSVMKSTRTVSLLFTAAAMAAIISLSFADNGIAQTSIQKVLAFGSSPVHKNDIQKSREKALSDSLVSAVETVALGLFSAEQLTQHFTQLNEMLAGKTKRFVVTYKLLSEAISGNSYRVLVEADISTADLKKQLEGLVPEKAPDRNLPSVMLFVTEQNTGESTPKYWWADNFEPFHSLAGNGIAKAMKERNYRIIEHPGTISGIEIDTAVSETVNRPDIDLYEAIHIAQRYNAEVIILGKAEANPSLNTMGDSIRSFTAMVSVRAFRTDTSREIAKVERTAVAMNTDDIAGGTDALSTSGYLAGEDLATRISLAWANENKPESAVEIIVGGIQNLGNFVMFRRALAELPGVNSFQIREMKSDEAVIRVDCEKSAQELADAMMLKTFEAFGINLYDVSENQLRIELVSK
jgi:hypothetical protein